MAKESLPLFGEALKAGQSCVRASVRARDAQYRFLALTYRAYLESKKRPRLFQKMVESRLGRPATKPEINRPFLHILHALVGTEDDAPRNALPQFSKMVSALEVIDGTYHDIKPVPKIDELIDYISDGGGVGGLYDLSRVGESDGKISSPAGKEGVIGFNSKATDIHIPLLGACITKVDQDKYELRLTEWQPGEYQVLIKIGKGGIVEALLDEADAA